jgi:hypothetical protein
VYTFQVHIIISLILFSLPRLIPLSLTVLWSQFMFQNSYLFLRWQVVSLACHPTPKTGWPSYTPRHRVLVLIACYNLHGLQWDCSLPRSPHGESYFNTCVQITFFGALYHVKNNAETTHFPLCVPSTPSIRFSRYLLQFFSKSCWISSSFIKLVQWRHTLLRGVNKISPYFLPSTCNLDKIRKRRCPQKFIVWLAA